MDDNVLLGVESVRIESAFFREGDKFLLAYRVGDGPVVDEVLGPAALDLCTAKVMANNFADQLEVEHGVLAGVTFASERPSWLQR